MSLDDLLEARDPALVAELERYNQLRNQWVQQYGNFEGFDAWFDCAVADPGGSDWRAGARR